VGNVEWSGLEISHSSKYLTPHLDKTGDGWCAKQRVHYIVGGNPTE
jgi:hypothetical protein